MFTYGFRLPLGVDLDYSCPNIEEDRIVESFDGFSLYLLVVDEVSQHVWVFLCTSKDPPIAIVTTFLEFYSLKSSGFFCATKGGAHALKGIHQGCIQMPLHRRAHRRR